MFPSPKRRIRIEGKPDEVIGYLLTVHDVDTGEQFSAIRRVVVYLNATALNVAEVTFYDTDEQGESIKRTVTTPHPDIAVTAFLSEHHRPTVEDLLFTALGEVSMCWLETPKGTFDSVKAKQIGDNLLEALMNLA